MYKIKFAQWKLWKTYRSSQKKVILTRLTEEGDSALQTNANGLTIVNNLPLKHARLARKVMRKGKRVLLTPTLSASRLHQLSMSETNVELALHEAKRYYAWYFYQHDLEKDFGFGYAMDQVFSNIASARRVIDSDVQLGFALMNTACREVKLLLKQQPFQLVQHIMSELGGWQWTERSRRARTALGTFFVSMAGRTLGPQHALCRILSVLLQPDVRKDTVPAVVRLMVDVVDEHMQNDERRLDVHNYLGDTLFHAGDLKGAESVYSRIIQCGDTFGHAHMSCRRAFRNLGWLHFKRQDTDRAKDIWLEVCALNTRATGSPNADFGGVCTCGYLGALYTGVGDDEQAECYLRLAFEGYLGTSGTESSGVFRYLERLESNLARQGKIAEIAELRVKYGDLWSRWEQNKLVNTETVGATSAA